MTTTDLLRELEPLTHHDRVRRMVDLGRRSAAEREPLLDELARGPTYERLLAASSCFGSRDGARAVRAALDVSRQVSHVARRLAVRYATDAQYLSLLRAVPPAQQRPFAQRWRAAGRSSVPVDTHVEALLAGGEAVQAHALLPYASPAVAARELPALLDAGRWMDGGTWGRVARWHPGLMATELRGRAQASVEPQPALVAQVNAVLHALAAQAPDDAVALVQDVSRTTPLAALNLRPLAASRPAEVAQLLLSSDDAAPAELQLTPRLRRLPAEVTGALLQRRPDVLRGAEQAYVTLPGDLRAALAQSFTSRFRAEDGTLPVSILAGLPTSDRVAQARGIVRRTALQTRPDDRMAVATFLPWDDALAVLGEFLGHPKPEWRALALSALIGTVKYDGRHQELLLARLVSRRNEQDPVRQALLAALLTVPPGRWNEASVPALGQVIDAALGAADCSPTTASYAQALVLQVLPFWPAWGVAWLERLVQTRGRVSFGQLDGRVTRPAAQRLIAALLPVLQGWNTREREPELLGALQALGHFVRDQPELLALLEDRVEGSVNAGTSLRALGLLREHAPGRFAALVPRLLAQDPSWATQALVYEFLHRHRQDLLTPFLGRQPFRGRFSTGQRRFVLPLDRWFGRWTLTQQRTFTQTLVEVTRDTGQNYPNVWHALDQLTAMPSPVPPGQQDNGEAPEDTPRHRLAALAGVQNTVLAVRDRAIRALGRLDEERGVPDLLACLGDDRARLAIYALRRPLQLLPPATALELLLRMPRTQVTVAKEVVRLIGDLSGTGGVDALLTLSAETLHRDVRVALLRGLWPHLQRPEVWPVLMAAAQSGDAALSDGLVRVPGRALTGAVQEAYLDLMAALLSHPDVTVRVQTLVNQQQVSDPQRRLLPAVLGRLSSPHEQETLAASRMLFASYSARDVGPIAQAFADLLPERRALRSAVQALQRAAGSSRLRAVPIVRGVLDVLDADPLTAPLRAQLATAALDWPELAARFQTWAAAGVMYPETVSAAVQAVARAGQRPDAHEIERLEAALAGPWPETRRIALAALVLAAERMDGWTTARLARLQVSRQDHSPTVASAAQFTLPATELG